MFINDFVQSLLNEVISFYIRQKHIVSDAFFKTLKSKH